MDYYESIHEEAPKEIVVMKNIAEAIQLCDMNAFDQFLKNLRKVVKDSDRMQPEAFRSLPLRHEGRGK